MPFKLYNQHDLKMKRKISILLFAISLIMGVTKAQWQQTNGPEGGTVNCIKHVGNQVWMGTRTGLYISSNNGLTWQKSSLLINTTIGDIYTEGDTIIVLYAVSANSSGDYIDVNTLTSFDGGNSWTNSLMFNEVSFMFFKLTRFQSGLIYIDEQIRRCMVSNDMGLSWNEAVVPSGYMNLLFAYDSLRVIISCVDDSLYTSHLFISEDMMQTWQDRGNIPYGSFWFLKDSLILYNYYSSILQEYLLMRSGDIGFTWDTVYYSPDSLQLSSFVTIGDSIYDYVYPGDPLVSTDNGFTWQPAVFPADYFPDGLKLVNGDQLYYDYNTRTVLRYIPSSGNSVPSQTGFKGEYIYSVRSCNNVLYASVKDALSRTLDGGQSWIRVCQLPPSLATSQIYEIESTHDTVIWVNSNFFGISFDNGLSWDTIRLPQEFLIQDVGSLGILGNRVYISVRRMYFSDDWGQSFDTLTSLPGNNSLDKVGFLEIHQNTVFAVNNSGKVFKYNASTMTWNQVFSFWSTGAHNGNTLYSLNNALIVSGRTTFSYSLDGGTTWITPSNNGLPTSSGNKIYPGRIQSYQGYWIGTVNSSSIYYTVDQGNNWLQLPGASNDFVSRSLVIQNGVLYTGSYYNSVWRRTGSLLNITGKVFLDANNNGVIDPGEDGIPQISLSSKPGCWMSVTDSLGSYSLITDVTGDTVRPVFSMGLIQMNPAYRLASQGAQNQNFGIYSIPGIKDLSIDLTNVNVFRPGFKTIVNISVFNKGSVSQSPDVIFCKPSNLNYISAVPQPQSVVGDTIIWHLGNLDFLGQTSIKLVVQTSFSTQIGDSVFCSAVTIPTLGDTLPIDNYANLHRIVQGSYDPNDKTCEQGDYFPLQYVQQGAEMQFTIRFQNMGNLATDFVRIIDTLSPYLDPTSFKIISSSHPLTWTMNPLRVVQLLFDPLALPPANIDELGSMGYIKYSVNCLPGTTLGSTITNQAYIYFDYNPPVITNMTSTQVANGVITGQNPINQTDISTRFLIYPNPSYGMFWVKVLDMRVGTYNVILMDVTGRVFSSTIGSSSETRINIGDLPEGIYLGVILFSSGERLGCFKILHARQ
jgi:hypothetical protein